MLSNCSVGEYAWESLGHQGDQTSQSYRRSVLKIHWRHCCWNWSSKSLATWCEVLTHWKSPRCWERLKAGGEGVDRGWDGWMASWTWWISVWASELWEAWTGKPGMLQSMGSQESDTTEWLNWTDHLISVWEWNPLNLCSLLTESHNAAKHVNMLFIFFSLCQLFRLSDTFHYSRGIILHSICTI